MRNIERIGNGAWLIFQMYWNW